MNTPPAKLKVLGTAAGGGLPQWNCGCRNCEQSRKGVLPRRLQSSLAFSADGQRWFVVDASPDLTQQLQAFPPPSGQRSTPLAGLLLTDAEFDHTLGLLQLREGSAWKLHATPAVHAILTDQFPVTGLLERYATIEASRVTPGEAQDFGGVRVTWVPLSTHTPRYHHGRRPEVAATSALLIEGPTTKVVYAPSLSELSEPVRALFEQADVILVDGTFYDEQELIRHGFSQDPALSMGHFPMRISAPQLANFPARVKRYTHLNNTNPTLDPASTERRWIREFDLDVLDDGWEINL